MEVRCGSDPCLGVGAVLLCIILFFLSFFGFFGAFSPNIAIFSAEKGHCGGAQICVSRFVRLWVLVAFFLALVALLGRIGCPDPEFPRKIPGNYPPGPKFPKYPPKKNPKYQKSVTRKRGYNKRGYCTKALFAHFCTIMRKFVLFCRPFWHEKTHRNAQKAQKHAEMCKNAPFCTDACNTPVYYTPVSVHLKKCPVWVFFSVFSRCFSGFQNFKFWVGASRAL